jgi:chromosome partitioning protein
LQTVSPQKTACKAVLQKQIMPVGKYNRKPDSRFRKLKHRIAIVSGNMGHIICIANLKGGVGKTTTAVNLSASFAFIGKKTLLIDCDPQGSATTGVGLSKKKLALTLYDALSGKSSIEETVCNTELEGMKVIPVRGEFFRAELELMSRPNKENVLCNLISPLRECYDYILLDTPPSLGLVSINAMTAADSLLIPLQCEFLAYESLVQLLKFARLVKKRLNSSLLLAGILLTMYDMGEKTSQQIVANARKHLKNAVFKTVIPRSAQLRESSAQGKPLLLSDPDAVGAKSYLELAHEIIKRKAKTLA